MGSRLAWLDHSEAQRQRMMEIVGLFRERSTVDDLGLGPIRDTFSDALFPGTSTLHTRTKYLLFVPWIFQSLERRSAKSSADVGGQLRDREVSLSLALQAGGETDGVIGRYAGQSLKQFPSRTYWGALGRYGIRTVPLTSQQLLDRIRRAGSSSNERAVLRSEAEESTELHDWHANLPPPETDFLDQATFELDADQGAYLEDRIMQTTPDSYLSFLIRNRISVSDLPYLWDVTSANDAPPRVSDTVGCAEAFSHTMHGAQLLYHVLVARQLAAASGVQSKRVDLEAFEASYLRWAKSRIDRAPDMFKEPRVFWSILHHFNPRLDSGTRGFVESWLRLVGDSDPERLMRDASARQLLVDRERAMKGRLARLSDRARLDTFSADPDAGRLGFRWGSARTVLDDLAVARGSRDA